jgi:hypothetical protein
VRRLAQGHLDTQQGGAGDRTSNLPVRSQPALPLELSQPTFQTVFVLRSIKAEEPLTDIFERNLQRFPTHLQDNRGLIGSYGCVR